MGARGGGRVVRRAGVRDHQRGVPAAGADPGPVAGHPRHHAGPRPLALVLAARQARDGHGRGRRGRRRGQAYRGPSRHPPRPAPAHALLASLRAAVAPMLVAAGLTLIAVVVARAHVIDYLHMIVLAPAVLAGLLTFWFTGGSDWIGHHTARWVAWQAG